MGHDRWLAVVASEMGKCANLNEVLVFYRRHGGNETGFMLDIDSKDDWYRNRVLNTAHMIASFERLFPGSRHLSQMKRFSEARVRKNIIELFRCRHIAPRIAYFEICLALLPSNVSKCVIAALKRH